MTRLLVILCAAFGLGSITGLGFAPWSLVWLAAPALVIWFYLLWHPRGTHPFLGGVFYGLGLGITAARWIGEIDLAAAIALLGYQSVVYGLASWLVSRTGARPWLAASAWFSIETINAYLPFGGFGWLRVGYLALDTPVGHAFPVIGAAVTGWFLLWLAFSLVAGLLIRRLVELGVGLAVLALISMAGALIPVSPASAKISVGWVQGGAPGGGIYGIGGPGETTSRHLYETAQLNDKIVRGINSRPAFVIWPENGIDTDPATNREVGAQLTKTVNELGVPLLLGGFATNPRYTRSYWWTNEGPVAHYDKIHIVPFGEYVPLRPLLEPIFPLLKEVGESSKAGETTGILTVMVGGKPLRLGILVCFDVAYPATAADLSRAEVIVVQSSNAMFSGTAQIAQQFAITRARAAELQRQILVVTTNGQSGLIRSDGSIAEIWPVLGGASGVVELERAENISLAAQVGSCLELLFALIYPIGGMVVFVYSKKRRIS